MDVSDEEALRLAREAVDTLLQRAQAALTFSREPADIKCACDSLCELLRVWHTLNDHVSSSVGGLLRLVRQNCKHPGAQHGYNERDGSWMNACPICGETK